MYDVWNWKQKDEHCMNVLEMLIHYRMKRIRKNKGLIRVGKEVMNALYEKNKGLIRVGKVMNVSSVIPCCKFSVKKL